MQTNYWSIIKKRYTPNGLDNAGYMEYRIKLYEVLRGNPILYQSTENIIKMMQQKHQQRKREINLQAVLLRIRKVGTETCKREQRVLTTMFSDVGVRKQTFAKWEPSNPTIRPLYHLPSLLRNLHFDPTAYSSSTSGSASISVGSRGSTSTSAVCSLKPCKEASTSSNNLARFRWRGLPQCLL